MASLQLLGEKILVISACSIETANKKSINVVFNAIFNLFHERINRFIGQGIKFGMLKLFMYPSISMYESFEMSNVDRSGLGYLLFIEEFRIIRSLKNSS